MEPKIATRPAFKVIGMKYHGTAQENEIPQLWVNFMGRWNEIQHRVDTLLSYGVTTSFDFVSREFDYIACIPVEEIAEIPDGMVGIEIPEGTYAEFTTTIPTMMESYKYANDKWLPQSGYVRDYRPEFEEYPGEFNPDDPESRFRFYVPIKKV
jgi:predicted transcriptional regulator YdeE